MQIVRGKKLKQIFIDYWEPFVALHPKQIQRAGIPRNVDKMLKCRTEEMGFHHYKCPTCNYEKKGLPHLQITVLFFLWGETNGYVD